jgi:putative ABC transport system permease protein
VLITSQFAIAVMLIIGMLVIHRQLAYLRNKPLGFQTEQVLSVPLFGSGGNSISHAVDGKLRATMNTFEAELLNHSNIRSVSLTSEMPGEGFIRGLVIPEGKTEADNIFLSWVSVDYDFTETLGIPLVTGRTFSKQTGTDHLQAFIINESTCRLFNWSPETAIGKNIIRGDEQNGKKGQVIGVIKDFNYNKLDQPLEPLIMDVNAGRFTSFAINVQANNLPATIDFIRTKWDELFPQRVFEFTFLKEDIDNLYSSERNLTKMISSFTVVAVFLACLGLFSLVSFMVAQRTREIGIRKVLGASLASMVGLLSKEFLVLILVALLVGGNE